MAKYSGFFSGEKSSNIREVRTIPGVFSFDSDSTFHQQQLYHFMVKDIHFLSGRK